MTKEPSRTDDADHGLLSCTRVFDEFESLSPAQRHHAKTYATGLVAASNKTVAGIAREVLPAQGKRALNKFLTEYNWDEHHFNHERLEELQNYGETRWSNDGYIILDDTITEKAGDDVPGVGHFYDHAEGDTVWGQDPIYAVYADDKTAYPLTFRLYEQQDDDDQNHDTKYDLAREIVTELEDEVGVPDATSRPLAAPAHLGEIATHRGDAYLDLEVALDECGDALERLLIGVEAMGERPFG